MSVKISIIIPVYNVEKYLDQCLDSVVHQTLRDIEIICINDGSTDTCAQILAEYERRDARIKIINQSNSGISIARNSAMKIAAGEYVQFLDADDWLDLECCEKLYNYAHENNLDMLSFGGENVDNETGEHKINPYYSFNWVPDNFKTIFNKNDVAPFIRRLAVSACLTIYKKSFLDMHNIQWIDKKICYEDNLFFAQSILSAGRVSIMRDKFYLRRIHGASITQNNDKHYNDWLKISELTLDYVFRHSDENMFKTYYDSYTTECVTRWRNMDARHRKNYKRNLYKFLMEMNKKYGMLFPQQVQSFIDEQKQQNLFGFFRSLIPRKK